MASMVLAVCMLRAVNIVPHPYEYDLNPYFPYTFNDECGIVVKHKSLNDVAEWLRTELDKRYSVKAEVVRRSSNPIYLRIDKHYGAEEYSVNAGPYGINIYGGSAAGVFYGIQSLLSFVRQTDSICEVPALVVVDAPRYVHRGWFVDISAVRVSSADMFALVDTLAFYKYNRLHLRVDTVDGANSWIAEVRNYASRRYIDVIVESADYDDTDYICDLQSIYYLNRENDKVDGFVIGYHTSSPVRAVISVVAETLWTNADIKVWDDFVGRTGIEDLPDGTKLIVRKMGR